MKRTIIVYKYLLGLILFFGLLTPTNLLAQEESYFGFGIGSATWDLETTGASQVDDSDTAIKFFGGRFFNENAGFEVAFADLGEGSVSFSEPGIFEETDTFSATALSISIIGQLSLSDSAFIFGKIGFAFWDAEVTAVGTIFGIPVSGSGDGTGIDPLFGFGFLFHAGESFRVRAEYERYTNVADGVIVNIPGLGSAEVEGVDVDVISVGFAFAFG